jgi:hypothetical protein
MKNKGHANCNIISQATVNVFAKKESARILNTVKKTAVAAGVLLGFRSR